MESELCFLACTEQLPSHVALSGFVSIALSIAKTALKANTYWISVHI
jgi:hypothetical protein